MYRARFGVCLLSIFMLSVFMPSVFMSSGAFAVSCIGNRVPLVFCKRCTTEMQRTVKRDTPCENSFDLKDNFVLVSSAVAKQAQHGKVTVSGSQWLYSPAKGFVGKDKYTLEWDFLDSGTAFVTFREVHVDVVE